MDDIIELYLPQMTGQGLNNWFVRSTVKYYNRLTYETEYMFLTTDGEVEFDNLYKDPACYYFNSEREAMVTRKKYLLGAKPPMVEKTICSQPLFED